MFGKQVSLSIFSFGFIASRRGTSDSVNDSSVLSNPANAQNASYLGLYSRDICPKGWA